MIHRLGEVGTSELLHTMAANAIAPFVLCTRLSPLLAPKPAEVVWGQIVNVTALEGKSTHFSTLKVRISKRAALFLRLTRPTYCR